MRAVLPLLALCVFVSACRRDREGASVKFDAGSSAAAAAAPLADGDVRVTSTDGAIVLAVIGDTVRMQLSDSLRSEVRREVEASADADSSGFGAAIARSVGGIVGSAMGFVVRAHVRDIENVRYEDGHIRLSTRGGHTRFTMSGRGGRNGDGGDAQFTPADGERFVAAVKARQAALR